MAKKLSVYVEQTNFYFRPQFERFETACSTNTIINWLGFNLHISARRHKEQNYDRDNP